MPVAEIFSAAVLLLLVIDPFGNVPIVVAALSNVAPARRARVVLRECAIAYAILLAFMFGGQTFLAWLQLSETSLAIAAGSSTQIALLVAPLLVLLGLVFGHWLTLVFHPLEIVAVGTAAVIFTVVSIDGESNWLEGVQLLTLYVMLAVVFFFLRV